MLSGRTCIKFYCIGLGFTTSFFAFLWMAFQLYILSATSPTQNDLIVARYLDISFGLLGISSSLALLYGAFVESKTWITVSTLGSGFLIVGRWAWFFYRKYGVEHPESLKEAQQLGVICSVIYIILVIPVLVYYRFLESNHTTFTEWTDEIMRGRMYGILFGPFCFLFSAEYYNNLWQSYCCNSHNNESDGAATVVDGRVITTSTHTSTSRRGREDTSYDWDSCRYHNSTKTRSEKNYAKHGDASYRYIVTSEGYRVAMPTGEMQIGILM